LKKKITKREQRAEETLVNNAFAKERVFYRLNERFVRAIETLKRLADTS